MSMSTITVSHAPESSAVASPLAPTLANAIAQLGSSRQEATAQTSVSVLTFFSFANLCQCVDALDQRFDQHLGLAIELPIHFDPQWHRLARTANSGGQLAIVVPSQSRLTLPMLAQDSQHMQICGWDSAQRWSTIDQAIEGLLRADNGLRRYFVLHAEWQDPALIFQAIGRYIAGR